uniref:Uncharacterized protein n=1 Tax=Macaca fascicularis TaxID=9541 RepID=A0A7N9D527_MACFA
LEYKTIKCTGDNSDIVLKECEKEIILCCVPGVKRELLEIEVLG